MAQKLNNLDKTSRRKATTNGRSELMKESLRRAEEIRRSLGGRQHSDSTILIAEDRGSATDESVTDREPALEDLLAGVTTKNHHSEVDFGAPVGKETW